MAIGREGMTTGVSQAGHITAAVRKQRMSSEGTRLQNPKDQTGEMLQRVKTLGRQAQCLSPRTCAKAGYSDLSVIPAQDGGRVEAGEGARSSQD